MSPHRQHRRYLYRCAFFERRKRFWYKKTNWCNPDYHWATHRVYWLHGPSSYCGLDIGLEQDRTVATVFKRVGGRTVILSQKEL